MPANHCTGTDDAARTDIAAVQEHHVGADPAVVAHRDALAGGALQLYQLVDVVGAVVLGQEADVVAHDGVLSDPNPAGGTEIAVGADARAVPDLDTDAQRGEAARAPDCCVTPQADGIADLDALERQRVDEHVRIQRDTAPQREEAVAAYFHPGSDEYQAELPLKYHKAHQPTARPKGTPRAKHEQSRQGNAGIECNAGAADALEQVFQHFPEEIHH